jgi:hypothetical protein
MVRVAVPYDPSRTRIADPDERDRIGAYLAAGTTVMYATGTGIDRVEPARGRVVGLSIRTDGTWAWSDALHYYLLVHGLSPEPALCQHIRECMYICAAVDEPTQDRVVAALLAGQR